MTKQFQIIGCCLMLICSFNVCFCEITEEAVTTNSTTTIAPTTSNTTTIAGETSKPVDNFIVETTTGCPAPAIRYTRPKPGETTTETIFAQFETTQNYDADDLTTLSDDELLDKIDPELSNLNSDSLSGTTGPVTDKYVGINPYRIEPDNGGGDGYHSDEEDEDDDDRRDPTATVPNRRRNKKRRTNSSGRRRVENENGSSGRSGRGRYERSINDGGGNNDESDGDGDGDGNGEGDSDMIYDNAPSTPPYPPSSSSSASPVTVTTASSSTAGTDIYYVDITDLLESEDLVNKKVKKKLNSLKKKPLIINNGPVADYEDENAASLSSDGSFILIEENKLSQEQVEEDAIENSSSSSTSTSSALKHKQHHQHHLQQPPTPPPSPSFPHNHKKKTRKSHTNIFVSKSGDGRSGLKQDFHHHHHNNKIERFNQTNTGTSTGTGAGTTDAAVDLSDNILRLYQNKPENFHENPNHDQNNHLNDIGIPLTDIDDDDDHLHLTTTNHHHHHQHHHQNTKNSSSASSSSSSASAAMMMMMLLDQENFERVKRKSGKTTGALSRPKGAGDTGSKSTSRKGDKDKGHEGDDGNYGPYQPDEEEDDEESEEEEVDENAKFGEVSEIRFPGEVGPLGDRRLCKLRCVKGKWVGPLCATNEEDEQGHIKFQPLYKSCHVNRIPPHLLLSYRNISVNVGWDLPHGHSLQARCRDLGLYKLLGESRVLCSNGLWAPRMPSCVPTTLLTNFSDDSPPSIRIKIGSGSGAFEPSGVLAVLPDSTIHLDCMYPRARGDPEWTWTGWFKQYYTGWSKSTDEQNIKYRLTINGIQTQDSGTFTCASPRGLTNSIPIIVATSQCPQLPEAQPPLNLRLEGNKLGHRALYRCPLGYRIDGTINSTCLASGNWSSPPPTCQAVQCPPLYLEDPHLSLTELNTSAWGRAVFKCQWGFKLSGPPGLECEPTGVWSGPVPRCRAIQCPQPLVPINGRIDGTSGSSSHRRYSVGALVTFSCTEGHLLVGEASIVCTETGFWSHPPPFCKSQCPYPGDPPNGLIAPLKFHYDPGDFLSVQCRPGYIEYSSTGPPERPRCLPDGEWSGTVPQCRSYEEV